MTFFVIIVLSVNVLKAKINELFLTDILVTMELTINENEQLSVKCNK
jgi:hypothetical protein